MFDKGRLEVKHVAIFLQEATKCFRRPNQLPKPNPSDSHGSWETCLPLPQFQLWTWLTFYLRWMLLSLLCKCSECWTFNSRNAVLGTGHGWGAGREVMGHSQDAPHGANSVGACPMWGMPRMGTMRHTGHAQHSLGLYYLLGLSFKCRAWKYHTFIVKWKV